SLSTMASLGAALELCANIALLCTQYSLIFNDAQSDIERLRGEAEDLKDFLGDVEQLRGGVHNVQLPAAQKLHNVIQDCHSQLVELETTLRPGIMSRFGLRALNWPFESKEVDQVVDNLGRYK
ncbi:hypothetical protein K402DRAFT_302069, partial [Aulographum hederae CBS 113979]